MGDVIVSLKALLARPVRVEGAAKRMCMCVYDIIGMILIVLFKRFLFQHAETLW